MIPSNNPREPVVFGFRFDGSLVNILKEERELLSSYHSLSNFSLIFVGAVVLLLMKTLKEGTLRKGR